MMYPSVHMTTSSDYFNSYIKQESMVKQENLLDETVYFSPTYYPPLAIQTQFHPSYLDSMYSCDFVSLSPTTDCSYNNSPLLDTHKDYFGSIKDNLVYEPHSFIQPPQENFYHTPSEKRPFSCQICQRAFARKYDLHRHVRIHTGDKPYQCPCCQKTFARTDALKRHLRMEESCRKSHQVQAMKKSGKRCFRNL